MSTLVRRRVVAGLEAVILENSRIRAVVIPSLGGRVWELVDLVRDRQWIWHREGFAPAATPPGSSYDDVWAGGWEELFPNDAPGDFEGCTLPDHGEWWTAAWTIAQVSDGTEAIVRLVAQTRIRRTTCVKEFRLASDTNTLVVRYHIESQEHETFHFLFKQHLPVALSPECRLVVPGGLVTTVDPEFGTLLPGPGPYEWPFARVADKPDVDLSRVPDRSGSSQKFVHISGLQAGWCGVDDVGMAASLRLHFDLSTMPYLWLFLSYGGWRDCYTAVLEPCSNMPKDLSAAVRRGQSAVLRPGGSFRTRVAVTLGGLSDTNDSGNAND